jgi:hypothetical protein
MPIWSFKFNRAKKRSFHWRESHSIWSLIFNRAKKRIVSNNDQMNSSKTSFRRFVEYVRSNGILEIFISSLCWICTLKWEAQKLRFLALLNMHIQMGCSKTSFPRFVEYAHSNGVLENFVSSPRSNGVFKNFVLSLIWDDM